MTEEKLEDKKDEKEPEKAYETTPVIERAREEREKMDAANKERKALLDREEAIMAKKTLGGTTAGSEEKTEKKEETTHEYRVRITKEMAEGKTEW